MNFIEDGSCGVIRFKTSTAREFVIPGKELLGNNGFPYTAHGLPLGIMDVWKVLNGMSVKKSMQP